MWHGPYIVKCILQKGAYELIDYDGNPLDKPQNGLYLKTILCMSLLCIYCVHKYVFHFLHVWLGV